MIRPAYLLLGLCAPLSALASDFAAPVLTPILEPARCRDGGVFVDDRPADVVPGRYNLIVRHLGADAITRSGNEGVPDSNRPGIPPVPHDVDSFMRFVGSAHLETGSGNPNLEFDLRRARAQATSATGSSAVRLTCMGASFYLSTFATPYGLGPAGAGPQAALDFRWNEWSLRHGPTPLPNDPLGFLNHNDPAAVAPFSTPSSDLMVQVYLAVPWLLTAERADVPGEPSARLSVVFYLEHRGTGDEIKYVVSAFDSRAAGLDSESVRCETGATPCLPTVSTAFVASVQDSSTNGRHAPRYATLSPYSASADSKGWSERRFFRAHVTQANLLAAIDAADQLRSASQAAPLPRDLDGYLLTKIAAVSEVFHNKRADAAADDVDGRDNLSFGASVLALGAWEAR